MLTYIKEYIQDIKDTRIANKYHKMIHIMGKPDFRISDNTLFMRRLDRARKDYLNIKEPRWTKKNS